MNWEKAKYLQYKHLGEWYRQKDIDDTISYKQTKMYSKLVSCGKTIDTKHGTIYYPCRLITCPYCCKIGAERIATKFLAQYPMTDQSEFRHVTLGLGYVYEPEEGFWLFKDKRTKLRTDIDNKRRSKSAKMRPWRSFSMCGTLDVTSFKVEQFELLGSNKQDRFLNRYGFKPRSTNQENVFEPHVHSIVHCGNIDENALHTLFSRHYSSVYIGSLYDDQSLNVNVHKYMAYSNKVRFATKLGDGTIIDWDRNQIQSYGTAVASEKGQVGQQMFIGEKGDEHC